MSERRITPLGPDEMIDYAQTLSFVGNSLLTPMNQTETVGIEPEFWKGFPDFDDAGVREEVEALRQFTEDAQRRKDAGGDPVTDVSVEFTRLFVGPPKPVAAPWETFYGAPDGMQVDVGFGRATAQMQRLLQQAGLRISNENNQYADHMGIELLYASEIARRIAVGESGAAGNGSADEGESASADRNGNVPTRDDLAAFVSEHPLAWIDYFAKSIENAASDGYFARVIGLAKALLELV